MLYHEAADGTCGFQTCIIHVHVQCTAW